MTTYKTAKFKKLQKKWYQKLNEAGFEDIEDAEGRLKATTHPRTVKRALSDREERETYYNIARDFLNNHKFESQTEESVWELHCEGIGYRTIAQKLGEKDRRIYDVLVRLQKLAGVKK